MKQERAPVNGSERREEDCFRSVNNLGFCGDSLVSRTKGKDERKTTKWKHFKAHKTTLVANIL